MSNKKNLLTIILVILIILNIGVLITIFVWNKNSTKMPFHTEMRHHKKIAGEFLKEELGLSEAQDKEMDKLRVAHRDSLTFWVEKMREKRNFLTMEMMKTTPDDSLLNATCDEIGDLYATIRKLNVQHYRSMKNLCNDEQKKKLDTLYKGIFCCEDPMYERFGRKHMGCGMPENENKHAGCGMPEGQQHEGCPASE